MTAPTPRDGVEIRVGYRGLGGAPARLETRTVEPVAGDAPPWDADTKYTAVGSDADRVDGLAKASGRAKYTSDVTFPGLLHGRILRAPIARGRLTALDLEAAKALPGISRSTGPRRSMP